MSERIARPTATSWPWIAGLVLLVLAALAGLMFGAVPIALADALAVLRGEGSDTARTIIAVLRGPRVVLAALVGAGLAMSGGALQGTLRNPLAEPYLLGVSGGAAVGAVLAIVVGAEGPTVITASAFGGAAVATALATGIARLAGGRGDPRLLLMAGVVVGAFANAAIMVLLADAPPDQVRGALWWMMGSVRDATWASVLRTAIGVVVLGGTLVWWARDLDVLALGEEPAAALGVDPERAARRVFLVGSWLAAATVAAAGLIGFVGLVVPHIARALGARQHRPLLLLAALYGAGLLVVADLAARTVRAPVELPLGALTALVGVPFFLARLRKLAS
ncbi:MAG: iron ABC transporter permease [Gemmatimonadetes bacterium]|nr:iron ABC transporter permease [Gemmatimonadota bacterium]